ncbi:MAG TPA: hypothetical protein VFR37_02805 [Longimicrobium sp.]|nr:hypothetical protein [Longimicrobium sp.]
MIKRILSIAALSLLVAACGGGDDADADAAGDSATVSTMPGTDTVPVPTEVQTTDSIVTTTDVDTIEGQVDADSVAGDTAH